MSKTPDTPALNAFLNGHAIRPIGFSPLGRPVWPIAGGAPDDGQAADGDDTNDPEDGDEDAERGWPPNTPVKDMTDAQRAAYHEAQARKHEDRNKDILRITGGKYGAALIAELNELGELRKSKMTADERAISDAEERGKATGRAELTPKLASLAFDVALAHLDEDDRKERIDALDLSKFINEAGDVDTDKVRRVASKIAPAVKEEGNSGDPDYGAGRRRTPPGKSGAAGASEADRRFGARE